MRLWLSLKYKFLIRLKIATPCSVLCLFWQSFLIGSFYWTAYAQRGWGGRWQINRERSVRLQWIHSHKRSIRSRFLFQIPSDKEANKKLLYGSNHFLFSIRTRPNQLDALYCLGPLCLWECFVWFSCFFMFSCCIGLVLRGLLWRLLQKLSLREIKWS